MRSSAARGFSVLVLLMLLAGACSSADNLEATADSVENNPGDETTITSAETTTSVTVTSATVPESTTSAVEESTTAPIAECSVPDLPAGDSTVPVLADLDADALPDTAYMVNGSAGWQLVVELGGGGAVVSVLVGTNDFDRPEVLGGADLDGDGINELAVVVANGAYVALVSFVRIRDCSAVQLAFEDDSPAIFASGASAGGGEALLCNGDGTLERFFFSWLPGDNDETVEYEAGFQPFRIEGDVVIALPGDGAGLTEDEVDDLELFDCLGLKLVL